MGRRYQHTHAFKGADPADKRDATESSYLRGFAYCGETDYFTLAQREPGAGKRATCHKCAAALGKLNLTRYGDRVRLEPAPEEVAKRFRSAWAFYLDGVERGLIACERGFGTTWELYALPTEREKGWRGYGDRVSSGRPNRYSLDKVDPELPIQPLHYGARDAMACGAVRAVAKGLLPTAAELEEQERQAEQRKAELEAERERLRAEAAERQRVRAAAHAERVETAKLGLADLSQRADLSNLERAGVEAALALVEASQP